MKRRVRYVIDIARLGIGHYLSPGRGGEGSGGFGAKLGEIWLIPPLTFECYFTEVISPNNF